MFRLKRTIAGVVATAALILNTGIVFAEEPAAAPETPFVVPIAANKFVVPELVVPAGATVTWVNTDPVWHNVIERFNLLFESPILSGGETWTLLFDVPGIYAYVCDLHANQEGVVVVLDPAEYAALVEMAGSPAPAEMPMPEAEPYDPYDYGY